MNDADKLNCALAALRDIAGQLKTDEIDNIDEADVEGGYDGCIEKAREALADINKS